MHQVTDIFEGFAVKFRKLAADDSKDEIVLQEWIDNKCAAMIPMSRETFFASMRTLETYVSADVNKLKGLNVQLIAHDVICEPTGSIVPVRDDLIISVKSSESGNKNLVLKVGDLRRKIDVTIPYDGLSKWLEVVSEFYCSLLDGNPDEGETFIEEEVISATRVVVESERIKVP